MTSLKIDIFHRQRGVATLLISIIFLFILSIGSLYANRSLFLEKKSNNNSYNNLQAKEAANSGLELLIAQFKKQQATPASITWLDSANNYQPLAAYSLPFSGSDINTSLLNLAQVGTNSINTCTSAAGNLKTAILCGTMGSTNYYVGAALLSSVPSGTSTVNVIRLVSIGQSDGGLASALAYRDIKYTATAAGATNKGSFLAINGSYREYNASVGIDIGVCTVGCGAVPASKVPSGVNANDQFELIKQNYPDFAADVSNGISVGDKLQTGTANWGAGTMSWTDQTPAQAANGGCANNTIYYTYPGHTCGSSVTPPKVVGTQSSSTFFTSYFGSDKTSFVQSNFSSPSTANKGTTTSADGLTVLVNCTAGCSYTTDQLNTLLSSNTDKSVIIDGNITISGGDPANLRNTADNFLYISGNLTVGDWATGPTAPMTFNGVLAMEGNMQAYTSFNINPSFNAYAKSHRLAPPTGATIQFQAASGWRDFQNAQ